ncbi:MAG TPA: DUF4382 domain-containing protein [Steroidobacteraceae bacterium]|nr:DUF4382 domain-containing protein [Steroidobacteraceae bacterium]
MNTLPVRREWRRTAARISLRLLALSWAAIALTAGGCGGGSPMSMVPPPNPNNGMAMVTLTDMPGDFLSYMVNMVSLKLTRADGTVVETVPATTRVDFAQLVNLSEVTSAHQVPQGSYTGVSLTLDYASATIVVDNGTAGGLTVPAAGIIDGSTSAPLTAPNSQMTVTLKLPPDRPLVVTPGTVANLALDFNLAASNTVAPSPISSSTMASAVTVTVNPVLTASLVPDATRQIRVRGPLVSVTNTATQTSYTVDVRPFYEVADADDGQLVVNTTSTTSFTLNGTSYTGNAGLTALAALGSGTLTAATGTFDVATDTFTAANVFAGTSVPGAGLDSAEGTVTARSGSVFTLTNGWLDEHDFDAEEFSAQVAVTVDSTTAVSEDGQSGSFGPQDISVGQHVQVFGKFGTDSMGNRTLDARGGSVRLMVTRLTGQFAASGSGTVTVNLQALDGRPPAAFNFAGTGSMTSTDANPSAYVVSVPAALPLPSLTAPFPVQFFGFVTPFMSAPPDFAALTVVNFTTMNARLHLEWAEPGITAPFVAPLSASNVMISQATLQSATEHEIRIGEAAQIDPATLTGGLGFVANTAPTPAPIGFAIVHRMSWKIETFSTFADFITALAGELNGTAALLEVNAAGPYDQSKGVLSVNAMEAELSN